MQYIETRWELRSYEVWGNAEDGFEVNDSHIFDRSYPLDLEVEINNPGTPSEFLSAAPDDNQIREAFGLKCAIKTDGDDRVIYVNRASDGYPIGDMYCVSHKSLSPIEEF